MWNRKAIRSPAPESGAAPSLEELAARQGVQPVTDFDALLEHPLAEDESVEKFAAMLREWRREGASSTRTQ
jgi:hypothetical protein